MASIYYGETPLSGMPVEATTTSAGLLSATDKTKIDALPETFVSSVNNKNGAVNLTAADISAIPTSEKAAASGVATLDSNARLVQMPTASEVGVSNRNLLDNWYFGNPINQRNATSAYNAYCLDRWYGSYQVTSTGVYFQVQGYYIIQFLESSVKSALNNHTITASVKYSDGRIFNASNTYYSAPSSQYLIGADSSGCHIAVRTDGTIMYWAAVSCTIESVKLELGSVSTLALDSPPDFATEFFKCCNSTADSTDIYANKHYNPIASNKNLLDNWYFGNPINQRGGYMTPQGTSVYSDSSLSTLVGSAAYAYPVVEATSSYVKVKNEGGGYYYASASDAVKGYAGAGYALDRWKILYTSNYIRIADGYCIFYALDIGQFLENSRFPLKADLTFSVMRANGEVKSTTFQFTGTTGQSIYRTLTFSDGNKVITNFIYSWSGGTSGTTPFFLQTVNSSDERAEVDIKAVKLELGSVSTLAYDAPPDYATELAKCQRYYWRFNFNKKSEIAALNAESTTKCFGNLYPPVPMRTPVSFNYGSQLTLWYGTTALTVTAISLYTDGGETGDNRTAISIQVSVASGLTAGNRYGLCNRSGSTGNYIEISSDL